MSQTNWGYLSPFCVSFISEWNEKISHTFSVNVSDYLAEAMQVFIESKNQYTYKLAELL